MFWELHEALVRLEAVRWEPKPSRSAPPDAGFLDITDLSDKPSDPKPAVQEQEERGANELD